MSQPLKIFIIYARRDAEFKDELVYHLKPLKMLGLVDTWHDGDILPGEEWDQKIKNQLNLADIVIPLISIDFINSDYIQNVEYKEARMRREKGESEITPVIVRNCQWQKLTGLSDLHALPSDGKKILPVAHWSDHDDAWTVIANELERLCMEMRERRRKAEIDQKENEKRKKVADEEKHGHEQMGRQPLPLYRYAVISGGIIILLLSVWLILKGLQQSWRQKKQVPTTSRNDSALIKADSFSLLKEMSRQTLAPTAADRTTIDEDSIDRVQLSDLEDRVVINFPYSSTRREDYYAIDDYLARLAAFLKSNGATITITGHTDFVGETKNNYSMGLIRANGIRDILIKKGVSKAQIKCKSAGESKPIAPNDTALGRYKNRRVEIQVSK